MACSALEARTNFKISLLMPCMYTASDTPPKKISARRSSFSRKRQPPELSIFTRLGVPLELPQNAQDFVNIRRRMVGADLKPDLFRAPRDHGKGEAGREHAVLPQVPHQFAGSGRITHQQRNNGVIPRDGLEAELRQAVAEPPSHLAQVL